MPRWKNTLQTSDEIQRLKRNAVLKEAGRAFGKRGYHNTSLDDVAKALNVAKGTLYNYVKDKQEILNEFHKLAGDIGQQAFAYGQEKGGTGAQELRNILTHYIFHLTQDLGACGALMEVDALRPRDRAEAVKWRDRFQNNFVAVIERGIEDGTIREIDPKLAVFTFMGAINWMSRWYSPEGRLTSREVAEQMTDMLLSGLTVGRAADKRRAERRKTSAPGRKEAAPVR